MKFVPAQRRRFALAVRNIGRHREVDVIRSAPRANSENGVRRDLSAKGFAGRAELGGLSAEADRQQLDRILIRHFKGSVGCLATPIGAVPAGARKSCVGGAVALQIEARSDGCVPADTLLSPAIFSFAARWADADLRANHRRLGALGHRQLEPEGREA